MRNIKNSPVILSVGDPNGIGPEIAVKAAIELSEIPNLRPVLVGDFHVVNRYAKQAGFAVEPQQEKWGQCPASIDLFSVDHFDVKKFQPGKQTAEGGGATVQYIKSALELIKSKQGRALVACPHSETSVNLSGRVFSGYPNLIAELLETGRDTVFMMLIGGGLRITHVTLHEPISEALSRLSEDLIRKTILATKDALITLGISEPRIGVFSINPHAGEGGLFGSQDDEIVAPVVASLRAKGINVVGPEGADSMLVQQSFDAYIAMYHDQGHIPIKLKAGRTSVALAIGSDVLFASVGHGAGFDIVSQDIADPSAVIRAIHTVGAY